MDETALPQGHDQVCKKRLEADSKKCPLVQSGAIISTEREERGNNGISFVQDLDVKPEPDLIKTIGIQQQKEKSLSNQADVDTKPYALLSTAKEKDRPSKATEATFDPPSNKLKRKRLSDHTAEYASLVPPPGLFEEIQLASSSSHGDSADRHAPKIARLWSTVSEAAREAAQSIFDDFPEFYQVVRKVVDLKLNHKASKYEILYLKDHDVHKFVHSFHQTFRTNCVEFLEYIHMFVAEEDMELCQLLVKKCLANEETTSTM